MGPWETRPSRCAASRSVFLRFFPSPSPRSFAFPVHNRADPCSQVGSSTLISSHSLGTESTTVLQAPWKSQRGEHMEILCLRHLQLSCTSMPSYYYCDDFQNHLLQNFSSSSFLWFSGPGRHPFQFCGLGTDFAFKIISLTHNRCTILIANSLSLTHKCTILIARVHLHSAVEGPSG